MSKYTLTPEQEAKISEWEEKWQKKIKEAGEVYTTLELDVKSHNQLLSVLEAADIQLGATYACNMQQGSHWLANEAKKEQEFARGFIKLLKAKNTETLQKALDEEPKT